MKVTVQEMMEQANCFGAQKNRVPGVSWWQLSFLVILSVNREIDRNANANMLSASR